tara:strand:- start:120 stop:743 length:624 start_codon:yes stop_codon:yes gene_type:complete
MSIRSKKDLELVLSALKNFENPSWELEQYATPENISADWIWQATMKGDIRNKIILDAACGPGILGIAALLMGAKMVFFLDKDSEAMKICQDNYHQIKDQYEIGAAEFFTSDITIFDEQVDTVLQNPPFGTKEKHVDKLFLETAFNVGKTIWSMHKSVTKNFVEAITRDHKFRITDVYDYYFPIKAAFKFHQKPVKKIAVSLWRMEKS